MASPTRHLTRCLIAGVVALLPLGGAALTIVWLESALSGGWLARQPFYFPGLGLLLALGLVYGTGLFVTTFLGRWLWRKADRLLERLPLLGELYQSLKEVLGYDTARDRFFRGVVLVPRGDGHEIGLITGEEPGPDGKTRALVFVPGSPNPMNGRLLLLEPGRLQRLDARAADALRALVSMGKTPLGRRAP
jgi:uncharacterized membrane protein